MNLWPSLFTFYLVFIASFPAFSCERDLLVRAVSKKEKSLISKPKDIQILEKIYGLAIQGENKEIRFGSIIENAKTGELVVDGSWNRLSRPLERKKYNWKVIEERLSPQILNQLVDAIESGVRMPGGVRPTVSKSAIDVSVHAEQAALIQLLDLISLDISPSDLSNYRIYTIGVNNEAKIGIALKRVWTCFRCSLWLNAFPVQVYELFPQGFDHFLDNPRLVETSLDNLGYWGRFTDHAESGQGASEFEEANYEFVVPELLLELNRLPKMSEKNRLRFDLLKVAAQKAKTTWKKPMKFSAILTDKSKKSSESFVVNSVWSKGTERDLILDLLSKVDIQGYNPDHLEIHILGLGNSGRVALSPNLQFQSEGVLKAQELGIPIFHLTSRGFSQKIRYIEERNLEPHQTVQSGLLNNPFYYKWSK